MDSEALGGKTVTILLVDDDSIDAKAVERAFRKAKIANPIVRAKDGVEALEALRGENGREKIAMPFLLLVDLNMPRMGGIDLIRNIREDKKLQQAIIFILTTSKQDEDIIAAYQLNVAGYIVKSNIGKDFMELTNMLEHYWRVIEFPRKSEKVRIDGVYEQSES